MKRLVSVFGAAALVLVSACGGESSEATAASLEQSVREMAQVAFDEPIKMYDYFTEECRDSISRAEWAGQAMLAQAFMEAMFDGAELKVTDVKTRNVTSTSGEASVTVTLDGEDMGGPDEYDLYLFEGGKWKTTDCETLDDAGESSSGIEFDGEGSVELSMGDETSDTVGGELRSADDALAEEAVQGQEGTFGGAVNLNGVSITVDSPIVNGDDDGPWLEVPVRVENRLTESISWMVLEMYCSGNPEGGSWQWESTLDLSSSIPSGTFAEGTVNLLLPGDGRYGEPIPECAAPAHIVASPVPDSWDDLGQAVWRIDDATVAALNSAR